MRKLLSVTAALFAVALVGGPALASKVAQHGVMTVDDKAGAFTADGAKKAEGKFEGVEFKTRTHYTVVTVKEIPENKKADFDKVDKKDQAAVKGFFATWAREMAKSRGETGVFTLIYSDDKKFQIVSVTGEATDVHRHFGDAKARALDEKFQAAFKEALQDKSQATRDRGLLAATDFLVDQLKDTTIPDTTERAGGAVAKKQGGGLSTLQWVLVIGGGLLVMWIVIGLIRALTGGGGGGGGYGGGGGGGGFFSSLMGGMFGAMAGMYLYNSMFGGGMSEAAAGDSYGSGDTGGAADDGNFDGGAEGGAGGGDWGGGDGAGGDWGGGGGDFGGGGDW